MIDSSWLNITVSVLIHRTLYIDGDYEQNTLIITTCECGLVLHLVASVCVSACLSVSLYSNL